MHEFITYWQRDVAYGQVSGKRKKAYVAYKWVLCSSADSLECYHSLSNWALKWFPRHGNCMSFWRDFRSLPSSKSYLSSFVLTTFTSWDFSYWSSPRSSSPISSLASTFSPSTFSFPSSSSSSSPSSSPPASPSASSQVWSLTQFYSLGFLQSMTISV